MAIADSAESPKDFGKPPEGDVGRWLAEIKAYEKTFESWTTKARRAIKRYRNESSVNETTLLDNDPTRRFNVFWANVQTLQPAIYSRMPQPDITRQHKDRNPVARAAAVILERAVRDQIEHGGFDGAMRAARDDYLIVARGQLRVRYVPTYGEEQRDKIFLQEDTKPQIENVPPLGGGPYFTDDATASPAYTMPDGTTPPEGSPVQQSPDGKPFIESGDPYRPVVAECVKQEQCAWEDFGHTPAPNWGRVRGAWFREMLTRDQLVERFGKQKGEAVSLTRQVPTMTVADAEPYGDAFKRAEVYEIWDKTGARVLWITAGSPDPLDVIKDPLHLEGFFPCPPPLYGTTTTDSLVPVTDYDEYRSQAEEIDDLTSRISKLTAALKIAGAYDGNFPELGKIFNSPETALVKVDGWAMFAEKGGIPGAISFVPIKEVAETIIALTQRIQLLKQDIQEITGISDIVRGQSDPNETLGAQEIKRQFVGMRIKDRQDNTERFARDTVRIVAEIVAEQFSEETLWDISGWQHTNEARQADKALAKWQQSQLGQMPMPTQTQPQMPGMMDQSLPMPPMAGPSSPSTSMPPPDGAYPNTTGAIGSLSPAPSPQSIQPPMVPTSSPGGSIPSSGGEKPLSSVDLFKAGVKLLRSDRLRGMAISIETDSMVLQDQQAEKQLGIEFVTSVSSFLKEAVPAAEAYPEMREPLLEMLLFGIRQFKPGTQLEAVFEALSDKAMEQQDQPKPPAPEQLEAQAKVEALKVKTQSDQAKAQSDQQAAMLKAQHDQQKMQSDGQAAVLAAQIAERTGFIQLQSLQAKAQSDSQAHELAMAMGQLDLEKSQVELALLRNPALPPPEELKPPSLTIAYKDLPPEAQTQVLAQAGISIGPDTLRTHVDEQREAELKVKKTAAPKAGP